MQTQPLEDLRILDFTQWVAGPAMSILLSFLGAEVIKVESHERPDPIRDREQIEFGNTETSGMFNDLNLNKLGVTIDLKQPKGVALALQLASICDAVTENFRAGVMDKLGLGYRRMQEANPRIVMLSISGFGQSGPDRENAAFASVFGATGGLSELTGYSDGPPMELRVPMDHAAGVSGAVALLAGLAYRDRTGKGAHIDVSAAAGVSGLIGEYLLDYIANGRIASRQGNRDETMAPHNCYPCLGDDRWVAIVVDEESEWQALCAVLDKPEWVRDERFGDAFCRYQNQTELDRLIAQETARYAAEDLAAMLQGAGVAATVSASSKDLCEDVHLQARQAFATVEHPLIGRRTVLGAPWKLSATPTLVRRAAPLLGEHNEYVFGQLLGMSRRQMAELHEEKVIRLTQ